MAYSSPIAAAQILWDFMRLDQPVTEPADAIILLGSYDAKSSEYVAELYHRKLAPVIVVSGAVRQPWTNAAYGNRVESELFADLLVKNDVPEKAVLIESQAMNTGENLDFSEKVLAENNYKTDTLILVQKPSFERRLRATAKIRWPEKEFTVTSRPVTLVQHIEECGQDIVLDFLISDFQRLETYRGLHLADEEIPNEMWGAFDYLTQNNHSQRLAEPASETLKRVKGLSL